MLRLVVLCVYNKRKCPLWNWLQKEKISLKSLFRLTARGSIDRLTQMLCWINRKQMVRPKSSISVKVNIGCGMTVEPSWINIDGSLNAWFATKPVWLHNLAYQLSGAKEFYARDHYLRVLKDHFFIHHNTNYGLPLPTKCADFVYSSHFLEHLSRKRGRQLLKECFRILKPGGTIRISVPDLEYAWQMYQEGDTDHMLHDYFFVGYGDDIPAYSRHRYAYDFQLLSTALRESGFESIERVEFRQGQTPNLDILDNREGYGLFVEAQKPVRVEKKREVAQHSQSL